MTKYLDQLRVKFRDDGVVHLPQLFKGSEIARLGDALDYARNNPSPMARETKDEQGNTVFFTDFFTYKKNGLIRSILKDKEFTDLVAAITNARDLRLFHDHILIKNGLAPETPWHQDRPYYLVDGPISFSVWMTPDVVPDTESLAFIRGSHSLGREFAPVSFDDGQVIGGDTAFEELDELEIERLSLNGVLTFSLQPGDALLFDNRIVHKALRSQELANRRALSIRFVGEGAFLTERVVNPTPPFHRMGLRIAEGKPVPDAWFPRVADL